MKKILFYIILALCIFNFTYASAFEISITGDRLSVHADKIPLQDILQRMVDLGINARIDPNINPEISINFRDRNIQKGLNSILRSLNYVLIWETVKMPGTAMTRLAEIQVFTPGKKKFMKQLPSKSNLSIARNPKDGTLFVKDEVLIRLRPGINLARFKALLRHIGGRIIDSNAALGVYKIRVPENSDVSDIVKQLINNSDIETAGSNYAYPISISYRELFNELSENKFNYIPGPEGAAPVAILDTGLRQLPGLEDFVLASLDSLNPEIPISDSLGHGTQMALIAAGLVKPMGIYEDAATHNPIIPIKAFDENGMTSDFNLMQSIDFALANGARVMSLSWGSETKSNFLKQTLDYADSNGLIIVASAGNEPTGKPLYPAAYSSVIGVGALAPDGNPWKESNYGDFVSLYAPGFAELPVGYNGEPGIYAGTSISTAFVSKAIADYLTEKPKATKKEIIDALNKR
ncbi:Peptidase S8/S53 domain-containing protein [Candidatus Magnetomoraceae bacterium gMMP-15]